MTEMIFGGMNPGTELAKIGGRFRIAEILGREVMKKNIQQKEMNGADGALYLGQSIPPRTIEIVYSIQAADYETLLAAVERMNGIFSPAEPQPLTFTDQEGTFYGVQSDSSEDSFGEVLYKGSVSIYCADPFRYGDDVQTGGTSSAAAPLSVLVNTNYRVLPVITLTTQAAANVVSLDVNGRVLEYKTGASIPAGTVIKIDGVKKEVRIGTALKVLEVSGWFPYLVGGSNRIAASVSSNLAIQYRGRNL